LVKKNFELSTYSFSTYEIEIPEYDSKEVLREKLLTAIFDGIGGFHIT